MCKKTKGRRAAIKAAYFSDLRHQRVGAALFKGSRCISIGWNCKKTHPKANTIWSQHAEFNVFLGFRKEDIIGCDLYIARVTRGERIKTAKPCKDCHPVLEGLGLNKVFYTNNDGVLEQLIF